MKRETGEATMLPLSVHLLPSLTTADELAGGTVVVIDVLRATTTLVTALANGARAVVPVQEVDEALRLAARLPPGTALLGGERGGLRIEGFDLGNSPAEYSRQVVAGRTIVFTTTNGTRALCVCGRADRVLLGALVNLSAVCEALAEDRRPVHLLCAGTAGRITAEDVLSAGAMVTKLCERGGEATQLNDEAELASAAWRDVVRRLGAARPAAAALATVLSASRGGRNLIATGQQPDILAAAEIDACAVVPLLDAARGEFLLR